MFFVDDVSLCVVHDGRRRWRRVRKRTEGRKDGMGESEIESRRDNNTRQIKATTMQDTKTNETTIKITYPPNKYPFAADCGRAAIADCQYD